MKSPAAIPETAELRRIAAQVRYRVLELSHKAETPHIGSNLSCVDIVVAAYWTALNIDPNDPRNPNRDRFILSKGHAALALFVPLAMRGFFSEELLHSYSTPGSPLFEHPTLGTVPGVEASTGSLGHGLPLGIGMALAGRLKKLDYRVMAVMSDGECNEGSVWEAAMHAAGLKLERLAVFIDYNKWQATGRSNEVLSLGPLADKWRAFGWSVEEVDGHDMPALQRAMQPRFSADGRPRAFIAHTVKGKGVSFMEDDNNWHYRIPTVDELAKARQELLA